jgi:hypothetical protein
MPGMANIDDDWRIAFQFGASNDSLAGYTPRIRKLTAITRASRSLGHVANYQARKVSPSIQICVEELRMHQATEAYSDLSPSSQIHGGTLADTCTKSIFVSVFVAIDVVAYQH